ncbi:MAG: DUF421 domain-containing protein [Clostridium sp.]|nr:DUF421 domain-containing protein [Clostridium sp.]MCM1444029.1 DUF421 domain-containing protein [Candidatus Amulumruptor caecigallinarius]
MYIKIILKTFFLYFFIIFVYRIMGKKEVGKLSIVDLIVSILIAELAALSIEQYDGSILVSVIPILCLVIVQILLGFIGLKSEKLRAMLDGKPSVIIKNGKINFKEMLKLRYSLDDLVSQLREQSVVSIEDVNYAVLENNGKLSIFKDEQEYPLPLILDGKIDYQVLKEIKKDEKWLNGVLNKNKIDLKNVFYAFYTKDKTFIIKKEDII